MQILSMRADRLDMARALVETQTTRKTSRCGATDELSARARQRQMRRRHELSTAYPAIQRGCAASARQATPPRSPRSTRPLGEIAEVYRQIPIYYLTNRLVVRGNGKTVRWPSYVA